MRQQEINFKCFLCNNNIKYLQEECHSCNHPILWNVDHIELIYQDKYLEIYEVRI